MEWRLTLTRSAHHIRMSSDNVSIKSKHHYSSSKTESTVAKALSRRTNAILHFKAVAEIFFIELKMKEAVIPSKIALINSNND